MKIFFFFLAFATATQANNFWFGKTMSAEKAEIRWGKEEFNVDRFKTGDIKTRSKMVVSLLKNKKQWLGKTKKEIREILGSHDGFYFSDMIPAYLVEVGKTKTDETWQVVFLIDRNYKVDDIVIHLNCCS